PVGHLPHGAVRADERDQAWAAVHVDAAATIHDNLVPRLFAETTQIGVGHYRGIEFPSDQPTLAAGDDEEAVIMEPVDAERQFKGHVRDLTLPIMTNRHDLSRAPIREPESIA